MPPLPAAHPGTTTHLRDSAGQCLAPRGCRALRVRCSSHKARCHRAPHLARKVARAADLAQAKSASSTRWTLHAAVVAGHRGVSGLTQLANATTSGLVPAAQRRPQQARQHARQHGETWGDYRAHTKGVARTEGRWAGVGRRAEGSRGHCWQPLPSEIVLPRHEIQVTELFVDCPSSCPSPHWIVWTITSSHSRN